MTTLTDFLLARIAEDEAVAQDPRYVWSTDIGEPVQNPARVLAECAAKRRIVEWHDGTEDCCEERYGPLRFEEGQLEAGVDWRGELTMRQSFAVQPYLGCVTLMHLASIYADHPDYRAEWAL